MPDANLNHAKGAGDAIPLEEVHVETWPEEPDPEAQLAQLTEGVKEALEPPVQRRKEPERVEGDPGKPPKVRYSREEDPNSRMTY